MAEEKDEAQKTCFVVMGFGIKTDYATGRKLDLNKSYKYLIQPVVKDAGIICVRADEIRQSGAIDVPMYQELLKADVVIADLSTANVNAFYELGIRHALRPRTTIVISEDKMSYPFDLNHIKITSYTHLGDTIDVEEAERFKKELSLTLDAVLKDNQPDSPVYTFLDGLIPPSLKEQIDHAVAAKGNEETTTTKAETPDSKPMAMIIEQGEEAIKNKDFVKAKALFATARLIGNDPKNKMVQNNDSYLVHRLALATYKAQQPDVLSALKEAMALLNDLDLDHTNDPETVALAGAIEKRLYEKGQGEEHLSNSILYYQRGYYTLNNRYNAINLAFLLNCRAASALCKTKEEQIADMVYASYTRQRVLVLCDNDWKNITERETKEQSGNLKTEDLEAQQAFNTEQKFWILLNKAEAHFGLGEMEDYQTAFSEALSMPHEEWMVEGFNDQIEKLRKIMEDKGGLLNPAWKGEASKNK